MTLLSARVSATIGRSWPLPLVVGAAATLLRPSRLELAPPRSCPGVLELLGTVAVRIEPGLTLGALLATFQTVGVFAAVAAVTVLIHRATRSAVVAAGVGLAVGIGPLFPAMLAPPWEAAALGVVAALALTLDRAAGAAASPRRTLGLAGIAIAVLAALVVPQWTPVAAVTAAVIAWRPGARAGLATRVVVSAGAAAGLAALVWTSAVLLPDAVEATPWSTLVACSWSADRAATSGAVEAAGLTAGLLGPLVLGLALLGSLAGMRRPEARHGLWHAAVLVAWLSPALWGAPDLRLLLTPLFVLIWMSAASGLQAIEAMAGRRAPRRIGAMVLVGLVPVLQYAHVHNEVRDDWTWPLGHERATLRHAAAIANALPAGSALVEEDSGFDFLWRVVLERRRPAKTLSVIPGGRGAVRAALGSGFVYALPLQQRRLRDRGFALESVEVERRDSRGRSERVEGLARVTEVRPCHDVGRSWIRVDDVVSGGRLALVSGSEAARGPVVVYLAGTSAVGVQPDAWPPRTLRGFRADVFDQRSGPVVSSLEAEARQRDPWPARRVLDAPFVAVLRLHRTARAPGSLAVDIRGEAWSGLARLERPGAPGGGLTLCAAQAFAVTPFGATGGPAGGAVPTR